MRHRSTSSVLIASVALATSVHASPPEGTQIVNGQDTTDWPAVAALFTETGTCSATFIGCRTLLTAAHCLCQEGHPGGPCPDGTNLSEPSNLLVFLPQAGPFAVESLRVHPTYAFAAGSDVAVLELVVPVRSVAPEPLNQLLDPPHGTTGTIVGFGRPTASGISGVKRAGQVTTASCPLNVPEPEHTCWDYDAPAGPPGSNSLICSGDSGGPLFADVGAGEALVGVHSGTAGGCVLGSSGFDADVFFDLGWITSEDAADIGLAGCGDGPQVGDVGVTTWSAQGTVTTQASHSFTVGSGTQQLRVGLNGELGNDFDLYLRFGAAPTTSVFDCGPQLVGPFESCTVAAPQAGTWHVLVDVFSGGPGDYQVTATQLPANPTPPALAPGDLVTTDFRVWEVFRVDPTTGDRSITSSALRGTGPDLWFPEAVTVGTNGVLVVTNSATPSLLQLDPATGNRTTLSGCPDEACSSPIGSGPGLLGPRFLLRTTDAKLLVTDRTGSSNALVLVDPTTGNRSTVSGCTDVGCATTIGTGPTWVRLFGIGLEPGGGILVADAVALYRVERSSGDRSVVSGCADPACSSEVGTGPSFGRPIDVKVETDGRILVTDADDGASFRAIFRVDPTTGDRTIVSGCADAACSSLVGTGPNFSDGLFGLALEDDGDLVVTDPGLDAVFRVDPVSGSRTRVAGCVDAACSGMTGTGTHLSQPLGITPLPEPDRWLSLASSLAFLALAARLRGRGRAAG